MELFERVGGRAELQVANTHQDLITVPVANSVEQQNQIEGFGVGKFDFFRI